MPETATISVSTPQRQFLESAGAAVTDLIFRIQKGYATIRSFPAAAARGSDGSQAGDFHSGSRTGPQDLLFT